MVVGPVAAGRPPDASPGKRSNRGRGAEEAGGTGAEYPFSGTKLPHGALPELRSLGSLRTPGALATLPVACRLLSSPHLPSPSALLHRPTPADYQPTTSRLPADTIKKTAQKNKLFAYPSQTLTLNGQAARAEPCRRWPPRPGLRPRTAGCERGKRPPPAGRDRPRDNRGSAAPSNTRWKRGQIPPG